jgi:hypothetical protein
MVQMLGLGVGIQGRRDMESVQVGRPRGFQAIGIFFIFGAAMAGYAAFTLLLPGTALDALWALNKEAHAELVLVGGIAGGMFIVLSGVLAGAAVGWLRRRTWGWWLGVVIVSINAAGDLANLARGEVVKGAVGVAIAGGLLIYVTRAGVRGYFGRG